MKDETSGFPEPIQLTPGGRAVAWNSAELAAWIEKRLSLIHIFAVAGFLLSRL